MRLIKKPSLLKSAVKPEKKKSAPQLLKEELKLQSTMTPGEVKKRQADNAQKRKNSLPSDEYKDEIEPIDLVVDENRKIVLSVKRGGEDGLPMCDVRQFQTTDTYTGFTKKGVNFPVELLPDLIELLQVVYDECDENELI